MGKLLAFIGTTVGGSAGWWIGAHIGVMTAFMLSIVGTGAGLWAARRAGAEWGG